ncbi:CopG family transcriptional regulator [Treponema sp. OMZ 799]|uniref:CopG family transcriptional regulator n=1 Tax=Treponema sp. OMZ 799 TaxID=2563668 RepID=UPI0020A4EF29|nr:CopG family transcriptional regulator [Treponema sp. OMZ 799]UTC77752.1 CopG family transcriptional regulator [Treponema sp. OMZ 799]
MTTVRLPIEYEQKLNWLSTSKKKNKSDLIKEALDMLFRNEEAEMNSYELGKEYFGKYGSGNSDLSVSYKQKIREKINAKYRAH